VIKNHSTIGTIRKAGLAGVLLVIVGCGLQSCETPSIESFVVPADVQDTLNKATFSVGSITATGSFDTDAIQEETQRLLAVLLSKHSSQKNGEALVIDAHLNEQHFLKGYKSTFSAFVDLQVHAVNKTETIARVLVAQDSDSSLVSIPFRYELLRRGLSKLVSSW
jgi:hypothetical protein